MGHSALSLYFMHRWLIWRQPALETLNQKTVYLWLLRPNNKNATWKRQITIQLDTKPTLGIFYMPIYNLSTMRVLVISCAT